MQYFYSLQTRFCPPPPPLPGLKLKLLNLGVSPGTKKERKKEKHEEPDKKSPWLLQSIQCTPPRSGLQVTGLFPARLNFTFPSAQQLPACHYRPSLSCSILPKAVTESRPEPNLGRNAKLRTAKRIRIRPQGKLPGPPRRRGSQALLLDS